MVRLYGRANGYGSHAQVTRGFLSPLREAGLLEGFVALDQDDVDGHVGGAIARAAVFTGPLGALNAMRLGTAHERQYVMVAPNSDRIPSSLAIALREQVTDVLAPSRWAAGVLDEQLGAERRGAMPVIHVVPHGVAPGFEVHGALREQARAAFREGVFVVAHLSSTVRERKGTLTLVRAWAQLTRRRELPPRAHLVLILDLEAHALMAEWFAEQGGAPGNVELLPRANLSPEDLSRAYSTVHVVCQPSRGEGFGMVPLEARACGVPVVATVCTGHAEHLAFGTPGLVAVDVGPFAPIDDLPGALAPSLDEASVMRALSTSLERWQRLDEDAISAAERVQQDWAWPVQLAPFLDHLRNT